MTTDNSHYQPAQHQPPQNPSPQYKAPSKGPWLTIGLGLVVLLAAGMAFLALNSGGGLLGRSATTSQTYTDQISKVDLRGGAGSVEIRAGGTAGTVEVTRRLHWGLFGSEPRPEESVRSGVLTLSADCGRFMNWCSVDYTLTVPDGTSAKVDQGSGEVRLEGTFGTVEARTGSGSIAVSGAGSSVQLETGSGNISTSSLEAQEIRAHTGSGGIDLDLAEAADSVRAETGSGGVTVRLPQGAYNVDVSTGSGSRDVNVIDDPQASDRVVARTGSGGVTIQYR